MSITASSVGLCAERMQSLCDGIVIRHRRRFDDLGSVDSVKMILETKWLVRNVDQLLAGGNRFRMLHGSFYILIILFYSIIFLMIFFSFCFVYYKLILHNFQLLFSLVFFFFNLLFFSFFFWSHKVKVFLLYVCWFIETLWFICFVFVVSGNFNVIQWVESLDQPSRGGSCPPTCSISNGGSRDFRLVPWV